MRDHGFGAGGARLRLAPRQPAAGTTARAPAESARPVETAAAPSGAAGGRALLPRVTRRLPSRHARRRVITAEEPTSPDSSGNVLVCRGRTAARAEPIGCIACRFRLAQG
ncbi:MAG: hypothetical protein KY464_02715, partial [Gemmatimonadetes bacterium]|nr:hypothetical protein [Gemmatimonadota bacterium]